MFKQIWIHDILFFSTSVFSERKITSVNYFLSYQLSTYTSLCLFKIIIILIKVDFLFTKTPLKWNYSFVKMTDMFQPILITFAFASYPEPISGHRINRNAQAQYQILIWILWYKYTSYWNKHWENCNRVSEKHCLKNI